jgi:hypothetical protein
VPKVTLIEGKCGFHAYSREVKSRPAQPRFGTRCRNKKFRRDASLHQSNRLLLIGCSTAACCGAIDRLLKSRTECCRVSELSLLIPNVGGRSQLFSLRKHQGPGSFNGFNVLRSGFSHTTEVELLVLSVHGILFDGLHSIKVVRLFGPHVSRVRKGILG